MLCLEIPPTGLGAIDAANIDSKAINEVSLLRLVHKSYRSGQLDGRLRKLSYKSIDFSACKTPFGGATMYCSGAVLFTVKCRSNL